MSLLQLSLLLVAQQAAHPIAEPESLVTVDLASSPLSGQDFAALDFDIAHCRHDPNQADVLEIVAAAEDRARLERLGIPYVVVHEDLAAFYASRLTNEPPPSPPSLGAWLTPPFAQGSMGGFYTFAEIESVLDQITAAYPALTTDKFSIGQTREGREIWAVKISDNPDTDEAEPEVRFDAMHHCREPQSMQTLIWMMLCLLENYGTDPLATYLVNERESWFLPVVNPDGYVYNEMTNPSGGGLWRKNRRDNGDGTFGVDLNRNYDYQWGFDDAGSSPTTNSETYRGPSAASEPETVAMQSFLAARDFRTALSVHCFSNVWIHPLGYVDSYPANIGEYDEISLLATEINGYPAGNVEDTLGYVANGGTFDYDHGVEGTLSWTPEIGSGSDGFWPATERIIPLAQENEVGFMRTALAAGPYIRRMATTVVDAGDGDGFYEPGETVELVLDLRNSGRGAATVDLTLISPHPDANVTQGLVGLGNVASFSDADNAGAPLAFVIDAGASAGTVISYTTSIDYQGFSDTETKTIVVGTPLAFITDDLELDVGWLAGQPGDTATTGIWELANPIATDDNGEDLNPGEDASAAGVLCFVTGNGGGSAGNDDVDDGFTTLITPAIDLSSSTQAMLSYSRWYADLGNPQDDAFEVSISDDDGASWVPLETLTSTENTWTEVSFVVSDFVGLTDSVRVRFVASDDPNNSLVEAAVDELHIETFDEVPRFNLYGRATVGSSLAFHVAADPGRPYVLYASSGTGCTVLGAIQGKLLLDPGPAFRVARGTTPVSGFERLVVTLPNDPALIGATFYMQVLTIGPPHRFSNSAVFTFE